MPYFQRGPYLFRVLGAVRLLAQIIPNKVYISVQQKLLGTS